MPMNQSEINRRGLLAAAFLATPAVLAASHAVASPEIAPADDMADWLDRFYELDAAEVHAMEAAGAQAEAEGRSVPRAEWAVMDQMRQERDAHDDRMTDARVGSPQTARRLLGWVRQYIERGPQAEAGMDALDAYLTGLEVGL